MGHLRVTIDTFNKEKALVGEFSGHCEILAKFVDSSRKEHPCSRTARLLSMYQLAKNSIVCTILLDSGIPAFKFSPLWSNIVTIEKRLD